MSTENKTAEKKVMGVVQILDMLKQGKTRKDIADYYGVKMSVIKEVFKDERLKGKKTIKKKEDVFILVEDEAKAESVVEDNTAEDAPNASEGTEESGDKVEDNTAENVPEGDKEVVETEDKVEDSTEATELDESSKATWE